MFKTSGSHIISLFGIGFTADAMKICCKYKRFKYIGNTAH